MSRPRVLVVDDKANMLKLCCEILRAEFDVETASNGMMALERLDAARFDVVLTDIRMPLLDGRRLLDMIGQRNLDIAIVLMTAYGTIEGAVDAMRAGAFDYVRKPFEPKVLLETVRAAAEHLLARQQAKRVCAEMEAQFGMKTVLSAIEKIDIGGTASDPSSASTAAPGPLDPMALSYREALALARERASQQYVSALLRMCEGNVTQAADLAGIERESLHRLMRRYGMRSDDFKPPCGRGGPAPDSKGE